MHDGKAGSNGHNGDGDRDLDLIVSSVEKIECEKVGNDGWGSDRTPCGDLAHGHKFSNSIFINSDGSGTFMETQIGKFVGMRSTDMAVGDIDGDGFVDILAFDSQTQSPIWYQNDGRGTFSVAIIPGRSIMSDNTFVVSLDASNADLVGLNGVTPPTVASDNPGYLGSGFVGFSGPANQTITFTSIVPSTGTYTMKVGYALAEPADGADHPLELSVNVL
jgi:hypothetical protein